MNVHAQANVAARQPYTGFDRLPIAGQWRRPNKRMVEDLDPYSGEVIAEIPQGDRTDLDGAYAAAARAQDAWASELPSVREGVFRHAAAIFEARREEIVSWLIRESGSTGLKANLEWASSHAILLWATSAAHLVSGRLLPTDIRGKASRVHRKPVGVVGVISPWNWPLHLSARSVAPALAVGNAVVIKPASDTPITGGLLLAKILEEAGLPPGLLSVIAGPGEEIGEAFVTHPTPRVVSFTGSTPVGRHIAELAAKAAIIKRVDLELGGNGPFVVLDDADLDHAVDAALFGKFLHQGQICIAINRIIVDEKIHDEFVDRYVARVQALKVGNPGDPETFVGPIINDSQLKRLVGRIENARRSGARQLAGGEPSGRVLPPHVFADVSNEMELAREEIFGPIAPVIRARGEDEALSANGTEYGLAGAVFTDDFARGARFAERMQVGMAHVNDQSVVDLPNCPFGGEKNSGVGRFNGEWGIEAFTTDEWVTMQHAPRRYPWVASDVQGPWS
jgi:acyl-CoA reductase-like NAD-dependent aldehyde dehydrogenase